MTSSANKSQFFSIETHQQHATLLVYDEIHISMKRLILLAIFFSFLHAEIISDFFSYREIDEKCVVLYLREFYNLNITIDVNLTRKCKIVNKKFESSISESIKEILKGHEINNTECAINLFGFYNINSVIFKALAYNHEITDLTPTFNPNKSCENVINFQPPSDINQLDEDCDEKVMTVSLVIDNNDNKSFTHIRHCLNDLFRAYRGVDKIAIDGLGEIFMRKFPRHLMEFLKQVTERAVKYCDDVEEDLETGSIEDLAAIDLFGFTEPSLRVQECIIDELIGKATKIDEFTSEINSKIHTEITFKCLTRF